MNDDEIIDRLRTRYGRNRTLPRADAERILDAVCRAGLRIVKSEIGPPPEALHDQQIRSHTHEATR